MIRASPWSLLWSRVRCRRSEPCRCGSSGSAPRPDSGFPRARSRCWCSRTLQAPHAGSSWFRTWEWMESQRITAGSIHHKGNSTKVGVKTTVSILLGLLQGFNQHQWVWDSAARCWSVRLWTFCLYRLEWKLRMKVMNFYFESVTGE